MQIDGYVQLIREDLDRIAAVGGDEAMVRAAELLGFALEPALARRLQEALGEAALELSGQLPDGGVEVRIVGSEPELVYVPAITTAEPATDEAFDARITLRLPERLKAQLDEAASGAGVSVNTWLVQTLTKAVEPRPAATGSRRLTGYGRA
ncbi:MAG TPA: toxin-antitoxin system HicB family antitoxin [Mycobacteriales bacterium]|nr:toxin-antitoxin system HicB family antitoxin [Mycobacteriales bacterium]HWB68136.1 toxin-antitoxin system HicB family antitoxin [Mycobacteriales bacterium]